MYYRKKVGSIVDMKSHESPTISFRILVVDDNTAAADSLSKLLTMKGHRTEVVYIGAEVSNAVTVFAPDIVLLDIGLPDMSGYDVAKQLRADGFTAHILAVSGYGQSEDKQKAIDAGFNHHFTKPLATARLDEYLKDAFPSA